MQEESKEYIAKLVKQEVAEQLKTFKVLTENTVLKSEVPDIQIQVIDEVSRRVSIVEKKLNEMIVNTRKYFSEGVSKVIDTQILNEQHQREVISATSLNVANRLSEIRIALCEANDSLDIVSAAILDECLIRIANMEVIFEERIAALKDELISLNSSK